MRPSLFTVLLCLLVLCFDQPVDASRSAQSPSFRIQLRSRQFVPAPGVEPAVRNRLVSLADARHLIVQLNAVPDDAAKQSLAAKGIRLLNYLPDHAWFAAVNPSALTQLGAANELRWAGEIQVADKLPERLLHGQPLAHAVTDDVLALRVYYFDDVAESAAIDALTQHGGVVGQSELRFHALSARLPVGQLSALVGEDVVRWVEEVPPPPTPMVDSIRSRMRVDQVQAAPYNLTGSGTILGIWDCTLVWPHVDFGSRLTAVGGQATTCPTDTSDSTQDHATHVAGIMAGSGANSQVKGGTPFQWKGIAPGAQIVSYDFYNSVSEVQSAISTYNIDLSQNSWGFVPSGTEPCADVFGNYNNLAPEYDQIVSGLYGKRIAVAFAAGNARFPGTSCGDYNTITPPGTAKNVITVGATNSLDDSMPNFSSWGPTDDGRIKPDVVAPGYRGDFSGASGCATGFFTGISATCPGNNYAMIYGTSMATPAVSGMLALLLQQYRITTGQPVSNPLPSTLKALTIHGAVDLGNVGPDYQYGWGRVDAKTSVDLTRKSRFRESSLSGTGQVVTYATNVLSCDTALKVTLAWDDPAAAQNASPALVNDLDLTLVAPNSTIYFPWVLNPAIPTNAALRGVDITNNIEQVYVANPAVGAWTIRVRGSSVPQGPQRFSVVSEALNAPALNAAVPSTAQPGTQIVLRGAQFDAGCSAGNITVTFGGNVSVSVPLANYTFDTITVTVPSNAQSGNVTVTTAVGTSNVVFLAVVRPSVYVPLMLRNYPPPFIWIDASSGGTRLTLGDDDFTPLALPFPFTFFGNTYTTTFVSSNGFMSFGAGYADHVESCIPSAAAPNNAIYGFWTDLDPSVSGAAVWSKVVGNSLVIEWQNVPRWSTNDLETFEVILGSDHSVKIQYLTVNNTLNAVVGIENAAGTSALQYYCTGSGIAPANNQVVYYPQQ